MTKGRGGQDEYLERLRAARGAAAVLKTRLVNFRAARPNGNVFAFEGLDDKVVYYHWIRRLRPDLQYEPFPCNGKKEVRKLKEICDRDLAGVGSQLFYFVDRDFDDLAGFANDHHVFMTDQYAVENYLVTERVLDDVLKTELPCHALPDVRDVILGRFRADYEDFLRCTESLNLRIFVARRIPILLMEELPSKLSDVIKFEGIGKVSISDVPLEEVIAYAEEPSEEDIAVLTAEFSNLDPRTRYRGKFAYKFFWVWMTKLHDDLRKRELGLFEGVADDANARFGELGLGGFASKSEVPLGLNDFLAGIAA